MTIADMVRPVRQSIGENHVAHHTTHRTASCHRRLLKKRHRTGRHRQRELLALGDDPPVTIYEGSVRASDGSAIPAKIAVTDGTLDLDGDQYELTIKVRVTAQGQAATQTVKDEGSFTRNGTQIVFESDGDVFDKFKGTLSGGKLKLKLDLLGSGDAVEYAYVK